MKTLYTTLFLLIFQLITAQNADYICGTEPMHQPSTTTSLAPNDNPQPGYTGSTDPVYLAAFPQVSFNITFWICYDSNGNSTNPISTNDVLRAMNNLNAIYKTYNICFVLKAIRYVNDDYLHIPPANFGLIKNYAINHGYVEPNSFNCYIPINFATPMAGLAEYNNTSSTFTSYMFTNPVSSNPYWLIAHELGHSFNLAHTHEGAFPSCEHVTRDPTSSNYNALSVGDYVADTAAAPNFFIGGTHPYFDSATCSYIGHQTDCQGTAYQLFEQDVRNYMSYAPSICLNQFTIGQGIRMRESIQNDIYGAFAQAMIPTRNIDLYMRDSVDDFGVEPDVVNPYTWMSPDIWIRHQNDYIDQHQNPEYSPINPNYIYVRVTNRGCSTSTGTEQLKVYWSKAATSLEWDYNWVGNTFSNGALVGNEIATLTIPPLQSNQQGVFAIPWANIPNPADYAAINSEPWHFCLLARIVSTDDPMTFLETVSLGENVDNNNNIAQKNLTVVDLEPNTLGNPIGGVVAVGNIYNTPRNYTLLFTAANDEIGKKVFEEAEVSVKLDDKLLQAWIKGGKKSENIKFKDEHTAIIAGNNAKLTLGFDTKETGTLNLTFNFLTKEITNKEIYKYHIIQKDDTTGHTIGGETYEISKYPRGLFYADAGGDKEVDKDTVITLNAQTINEPATYNWYDSEGNLIYQGANFTTSVEVGKKYKLEVIALSDGYKDYSEVEIKLKPNAITALVPNPATNETIVQYKINEGDTAYLSVTPLYGANTVSYNYVLNIEETEAHLNLSNYPPGIYAIALITNGHISDTSSLIKQ